MRRPMYKETTGVHAARFFTESARRMVAAGVSATLAFSLAACGATNATTETGDAKSAKSAEATTSETAAAATADSDIYEVAKAFTIDATNLFSARDTDASYDADRATRITLADVGVTLKGTGATVEGSNVTITDEGTYVVEGTISDGRIVVDAADNAKVQIVLAGASITSSGPSALYVRNADKVFLTLEGDKNAVSATGADAEEDEHNLDGTIFASVDLTINGTGSLNVKSAQGAGIVAKDELTLFGPTLTVDGATHAVTAKDSLAVDEGTYTFTAATKDAIHVEHDTNGNKGFMYVSGGTFNLTAADDGIHASNDILIDGGTFKIAAKDDGVHSEYDLVVNDGTIDVTESGEGIEGATFTQNGGDITAKASDDGVNATGYPTAEKDARSAEFAGKGNGGWSGDRPDMDDLMEREQREVEGQTPQDDATAENNQTQAPQGEANVDGGQNQGQPPMRRDGGMGRHPGGPAQDGQMGEPPVAPDGEIGQGNPRQMGDAGQQQQQSDGASDAAAAKESGSSADQTKDQTADIGSADGTEKVDAKASAEASEGNAQGQWSGRGGMGGPGAMMMDVDETADLVINGGTLTVDAAGDGLDSNGTIHFNGGEVYVSGPTNSGNTAIDCGTDTIVNGGILVASGSSGMVEPFSSEGTQATMIVNAAGSAGDAIVLKDSSGKQICSFTPAKAYQCVEITAPGIKEGQTYTLAHGSETTTVVMESLNYSDVTATMGGMGMGGHGGMGGFGGGRGQKPTAAADDAAPIAQNATDSTMGQSAQSS